MKFDNMTIEFLPDGRIKVITDKISMPNHTNADLFIKQLARDIGGEIVYEKRTDSHSHHGLGEHSHSHGDEHSHS